MHTVRSHIIGSIAMVIVACLLSGCPYMQYYRAGWSDSRPTAKKSLQFDCADDSVRVRIRPYYVGLANRWPIGFELKVTNHKGIAMKFDASKGARAESDGKNCPAFATVAGNRVPITFPIDILPHETLSISLDYPLACPSGAFNPTDSSGYRLGSLITSDGTELCPIPLVYAFQWE